MSEIQGTVYGALKSKANSRVRTKSGLFIKSQGARDFCDAAITQLRLIKGKRKTIEGEVGLEITIFYPSKRSDLSPELFLDCLQHAELISNDRNVREYFCRKEVDSKNPRVIFCIYEIE